MSQSIHPSLQIYTRHSHGQQHRTHPHEHDLLVRRLVGPLVVLLLRDGLDLLPAPVVLVARLPLRLRHEVRDGVEGGLARALLACGFYAGII